MVTKNQVVFINEHYSWLSNFIMGIPSSFEGKGELIRDKRNTIKCFHVGEKDINVKQFCIPPYFWNRIVYCYFREPKALRAYTNAIKLKELGIETPTPIAYMLFKRRGVLSKCYFVSEQLYYDNNIHDFIVNRESDEQTAVVLSEFGRFTGLLHNLGVYHYDYSDENILINYVDNHPIFSLIDVNRMSFTDISLEKGCKNFDRLAFTPQQLEIVAKSYAEERGCDREWTIAMIKSYRERRKRHKSGVNTIKKLLTQKN